MVTGRKTDDQTQLASTASLPPEENMEFSGNIFARDIYIDSKNCVIEFLSTWNLDELPLIVMDRINEIKAKRFVLDTITLVCSELETERLRSEISEFFNRLKHSGATSLLICEIPEATKALSTFGVEEYLVDGILVLNYLEFVAGGSPRSLLIRKMRRTKHGSDIYPFQITKKGIELK